MFLTHLFRLTYSPNPFLIVIRHSTQILQNKGRAIVGCLRKTPEDTETLNCNRALISARENIAREKCKIGGLRKYQQLQPKKHICKLRSVREPVSEKKRKRKKYSTWSVERRIVHDGEDGCVKSKTKKWMTNAKMSGKKNAQRVRCTCGPAVATRDF